jgi:hypothetical protein
MSLMLYVNEEINERRGLEYLRNAAATPEIFRQILTQVCSGVNRARSIYTRGALDMSLSFELLRTATNQERLIRTSLVVAPPSCKKFKPESFTTFLVIVDPEGSVIGVCDNIPHC